jgi:hypothetical protein
MEQGTENTVQIIDAAPVLTQEFLADLDANPHKMSEQPKAIRNAVLAHIANPTDLSAAAEPEVKVTATDPVKPASVEEAPTKTIQQIKQEQKAAADAANRDEQKLAAAKARQAKAAAELAEFEKLTPESAPEDYLDDSHQESVHARLTRIEKENEAYRKYRAEKEAEEIEALTKSTQTRKEAQLFDEVAALQADDKFAAIRMKTPFAKANADYASWLDNLVQLSGVSKDQLTAAELKSPTNALRNRAMARFDSDPDFKASVKVAPPEELEKLYLILEAHDRKRQHGGNLKGHIFEILDEQGILGNVMHRDSQDAARTAANKTADAIRTKTTDLQTISPDDGVHKVLAADQTLTAQSAAAFMTNLKNNQLNKPGYKMTADEKAMLAKIRNFAVTL